MKICICKIKKKIQDDSRIKPWHVIMWFIVTASSVCVMCPGKAWVECTSTTAYVYTFAACKETNVQYMFYNLCEIFVTDIILRNAGTGRKVKHLLQWMEIYQRKCTSGNETMEMYQWQCTNAFGYSCFRKFFFLVLQKCRSLPLHSFKLFHPIVLKCLQLMWDLWF